jgi:hypothetical protein
MSAAADTLSVQDLFERGLRRTNVGFNKVRFGPSRPVAGIPWEVRVEGLRGLKGIEVASPHGFYIYHASEKVRTKKSKQFIVPHATYVTPLLPGVKAEDVELLTPAKRKAPVDLSGWRDRWRERNGLPPYEHPSRLEERLSEVGPLIYLAKGKDGVPRQSLYQLCRLYNKMDVYEWLFPKKAPAGIGALTAAWLKEALSVTVGLRIFAGGRFYECNCRRPL